MSAVASVLAFAAEHPAAWVALGLLTLVAAGKFRVLHYGHRAKGLRRG